MIDISDFECIKKPLEFFFEISKIPRGSGNSKGIADYLEAFAKERGLFYVRDTLDNLIIRKAATKGYENKPGVIFQGHTDMVAEKAENVNIDMQKEGLTLYRDGDFLRARGTTLGGDDGTAVAYALAVLDSDDIPHPEFEAIFTTDEEVGLTGATGIDLSVLKGRLLVNIDSDNEGLFTVGCAGGVRADIALPVKREKRNGYTYRISLT
ncbi:MAG: M20/M25/M40 family metallo-hydrolase, partial [Clostridia bacterium]|nr:M20/M25/M40 family metallo-hydrolase [Clostridia bacterium]